MAGALDGIRVLEVANFIAGPHAGLMLAELGAEVIKVENPDGGDPFRAWDLGGDQPTFWAYNHGKKAITLNLRVPAARDVFHTLALDADVVVENLRPGVMERLGVGYPQLSELNPRLVYCSVTGFGPTGPYARRPAYDGVAQALGGLVNLLTDRENPRAVGPNSSDCIAAMYATIGILGALVARQRTGRGQKVESTLVGGTLAFLTAAATETLGGNPPPGPLSRPIQSQTHCWKAGDGLPFSVHLSSPQKFWEGLVRTVDRPELLADARFATRAARRDNYHALHDEFAAIFVTKPRAYWMERLEAEDVPAAPNYDMREIFEDPQIKHMGLEIALPRKNRSTIRTVACPLSYSETPPPQPLPPPDLGEHTEEVLLRAGYDHAAIEALRAQGAL